MPQFRKKPVVVEAYQLPAEGQDVPDSFHEWCSAVGFKDWVSDRDSTLTITSSAGDLTAQPGDWIVREVSGEFYPVRPTVFAASYEDAGAPAKGEMTEREKFEAAYIAHVNQAYGKSHGPQEMVALRKGDGYDTAYLNGCWWGWQQRTKEVERLTRWQDEARANSPLLARLDGVRSAARNLVDALEASIAHPSYMAVHKSALDNGVKYEGPTCGGQITALRAWLDEE